MNIAPISSAIASTLKASEVLVAWTRPCPMPGKAKTYSTTITPLRR